MPLNPARNTEQVVANHQLDLDHPASRLEWSRDSTLLRACSIGPTSITIFDLEDVLTSLGTKLDPEGYARDGGPSGWATEDMAVISRWEYDLDCLTVLPEDRLVLWGGRTGAPKIREYPLRDEAEGPFEVSSSVGHGEGTRVDDIAVMNGLGVEQGYTASERVLVTVGDDGDLLQWRLGTA